MTAQIIWDFVELRDKQIAEKKLANMADVIAFALDGAPQAYVFPYGDNDLVTYVSPSPFIQPPSDTEPA